MVFALSPEEIDEIATKAVLPIALKLSGAFEQKASEENDDKKLEALRLICRVLRLGWVFHPSDVAHPFGKPGGFDTHENISTENAAILGEIAPNIQTAEIRALFADVAWLRSRGDPANARLAATSYIESARASESPNQWVDTVARVERAMRLSRSLGDQDPAFEAAKSYALELVHKYKGEDPHYLTGKIVELLLEFRIGEPSDYITYIQRSAHAARDAKNHDLARYHFELLVKLYRRASNEAAANNALRDIARTLESEAQERETSGNYMAAAHFFTSAIQAYRRIPNSSTEIEAIRLDLQRVERASVTQMKRIQSEPVNITGEVIKAREHVSGHDCKTAMLKLARVVQIARVEDMRTQAARMAEMSLVRKLANVSHVDGEGRVVGRDPSATSDEATFADLVEYYRIHRGFVVQAYILPALEQFNLEHSIALAEMVGFSHYSPFIPEGREIIFSKGLQAGFDMDFLLAAHLLVPQIESSLRFLMENKGIITTKLDQYGIQRHRDLSELLLDERIRTLLSEDVIVELRTLLIDNRGPNLRHQLAHGMLDDAAFMSAECIYIWWLVLNLCIFWPSLQAQEPPTAMDENDVVA